jgi:pimeloyl-ACP methyl ester carboxylesterase
MLAAALLALSGTQSLAAEPEVPVAEPPDYADQASWLCRPDNIGFCQTNLDATIVEADGTLTVERWQPPGGVPEIDCFYLYPTASADMAPNSDLVPGELTGEEIHTVRRNFARFAGTCRLFAPIYRSSTLTQMRGQVAPGDRELAYADVLAAWRHYLAHDNGGRGVVLIGHSQGSAHIRRLLMEEIDGKPVQALLVSALPIGTNVTVPARRDVGGDLQHIPVCRSIGQTGCLVTYNTYRAEAPPPGNAVLGGRAADGLRHVCVNPAAPEGGSAELNAYLETTYTMGAQAVAEQQPWSKAGAPITTPYVRVPGLLRARCVSDDHGDYLALSIDADAADPRVDDVSGEVRREGRALPEWGFHVIDIELAMGDLVNLVRAQAANWHGLPGN